MLVEIGKRKNRKQITIHVDVEMWKSFKQMCIDMHESYSDVINRMIKAVLNGKEEAENE